MSAVFTRALPTFRLVVTEHGDTMQRIAAREMGDANRWPEIVWLNNLSHPYITSDPQRVKPGVLRAGDFIKIPAAAGVYTDGADKGQVYERDCAIPGGQLQVDPSGDFSVLTGRENLRQQLQHRIATPRGQASRHPEYGCLAYRLIGKVNAPTAAMLGAQYIKSALLADYRVKSVSSATGQVVGDSLKVRATAEAIQGGVVDILVE